MEYSAPGRVTQRESRHGPSVIFPSIKMVNFRKVGCPPVPLCPTSSKYRLNIQGKTVVSLRRGSVPPLCPPLSPIQGEWTDKQVVFSRVCPPQGPGRIRAKGPVGQRGTGGTGDRDIFFHLERLCSTIRLRLNRGRSLALPFSSGSPWFGNELYSRWVSITSVSASRNDPSWNIQGPELGPGAWPHPAEFRVSHLGSKFESRKDRQGMRHSAERGAATQIRRHRNGTARAVPPEYCGFCRLPPSFKSCRGHHRLVVW
jgi:hypothetical protein